MAKRNYGGVYANMEFPPYQYEPYPRHIPTGPHGKYEVANNEDEEKKILAKLQKDNDNAPAEIHPPVVDPDKEILIARARELGVPFNSMWSKQKLQRLINDAESVVDDLPPEEIDEDKLKDELVLEARGLGISANRTWGIPRLRAVINEARSEE